MKKLIANTMLSMMAVSLVAPASVQGKNIIITEPTAQVKMAKTNSLFLVSDVIYQTKIPQLLAKEKVLDEKENVKTTKKEKKLSKEESAKLEFEKHMDKHGKCKDKEKWFKEYKSILNKYRSLLDKPESIYDTFNKEELQLLFSVVQAEIGDQYTFIQKTHVASVIFNRLNHEKFPNALSEILTHDQFATISNGSYRRVEISDMTKLACEYAFEIEDTANGCLFFDSNNALKYKFVYNDGAHNFYNYHKQ